MKETVYQNIIMQSDLGFALLQIIQPEKGNRTDFRFVEVNQAFENLIGLSSNQIIGKSILEFNSDNSIPEFDWLKVLYEKYIVHEGKKEIEIYSDNLKKELKISLINYDYKLLSIIIDVNSTQKEKDYRAEISDKDHVFLFENMLQGVVYHNSDGKVINANSSACIILGLTTEQLNGKTPIDTDWHAIHADGTIFPGETHPAMVTLKTGKIVTDTVMGFFNHKNNNYTWININSFPIINPNDNTIFQVLVTFENISKRIQAEKVLSDSEANLKATIENATDAIGMATIEGMHYYQNKAFDDLFGTISRDPSNVYFDKSIAEDVFSSIKMGRTWSGEIKMYDKYNQIRDISLRAYANKDEKGNITNLVGIHTDITERKKSENNLIEKNFFISSLLHAIPVAVFYKDKAGSYLGCNEVFSEIMGIRQEEIIGKNVFDLWPDEMASVYHQKDIELMNNPRQQKYEYQVKDKNGLLRPVIYAKDVFYDSNGNVAGIVGAFIDISEIKNAEQKLLESEANLKAIIENSLESIWSINKNYEIQYVNEVFARSFEESFGVYLTKKMNILEKLPRIIRPLWKERYDRAFKNEHFVFEDKLDTNNGNLYIEVAMNPIVVDGKVTGASFYGKNVTEQRMAEESLKQSIERNKALLDSNPDLMFVFDKDYKFVDYHAENEKQLLMKPEFFMGKCVDEVLPPELADLCRKNVDLVIHTSKQSYSTYVIEKEGIKEFYESRYVLCGKNEVMSIVRDITARKLAEDALIESEEKYRLLAENITDVIWTMDLSGKYHYVSPSVFAMRGYTAEENMNQSFNESLTPESAKIAHKLFADAKQIIESKVKAEPRTVIFEQTCKNGSTVWTEIMMSGIYDENENFKYFLGVTRDISQRKKAEDELIKHSELRQLLIEISTGYINLPYEYIEDSINTSLQKIALFSQADRSYIFDFNMNTKLCSNTYEWCNLDILPKIDELQNIPLPKEWSDIFIKSHSVYIPDILALPAGDVRNILEPQGIKSLIAVPLMNLNICIGFVGFDYVNKYHSYSNIEKQLLAVFAEMLVNIKLKKESEEELIKAKEIAEENEKRFNQIADNLSNGMIYQIIVDGEKQRRFGYISNKVKEFYGCSIEEAKTDANLIYSRVHKDDLQNIIDGELEALKNFSIFQSVVRMINPNGSTRWSYFVSSPRKLNEQIMWDGIEIDITHQKQVENELIFAKEKAEESDRLKSIFLANVSHEIRTPMNAILGFLGLLKEPDLNPERINNYIEIVNQSGQRLLNTINDIIEISKIEAGQSEVVYTVVNIMEVMHFHFDLFKRQADDKGIVLNLSDHIRGKSAYIKTDKNKLDSILTNLINNAIKFTTKGVIEFGNYIRDDTIVFYIKDSGIGIPDNRLDAIFERFVQADTDNTRPHEGSGLGLSIVKAYVGMLKGDIKVQSEQGIGSTFTFNIPYLSAEEEKIIQGKIQKPSDMIDKINTVLIAEDDEYSFLFFEDTLKSEGITIIRAINGEEALKYIKENPSISLILMDIKMPGMDGLEATRQIRLFNKKIPIIAQTAYAFSGDKEKALEAGCNDYISKPIKFSELIGLLNKYLE